MNLLRRLYDQSSPKKAKTTQYGDEEPKDNQVHNATSTVKNWLCPYGPERINETYRLCNIMEPVRIDRKWFELIEASNLTWGFISSAEMLDLLRDERHRWNRIMLPSYSPAFFELLHLHPCEELRLEFDNAVLTHADFLNIAKCTDLRLLDMGPMNVHLRDLCVLQHLPKLEKIIFCIDESAFAWIDALRLFPKLTVLPINASEDCEVDCPTYPFAENVMAEALSYINSRQETIRELHLSVTMGPIVLATLGHLKHVESIVIKDFMDEHTGCDLYLLFMSPNIQKSVRHLYLSHIDLDARALTQLPKFRELRLIDFRGVRISTDALLALIYANAEHLESLTVSYCHAVGDAVLEGVASCERLRQVEIWGTAVTTGSVEQYRKAKRPNWQILFHKAPIYAKNSLITGSD